MSDAALTGRFDAVISLLTRLAAGQLEARGTPSDLDDDIDSVIVGINMLAEELQASHEEMERRVMQRTHELQQLNRDITQLTELGNLLQACDSVQEAFDAMSTSLSALFDGLSGVIYVYRSSRNVLEPKVIWGDLVDVPPLAPKDCWALRRGQSHVVKAENPALVCQHRLERQGDSVCVPMSAHGETSGLLHLVEPARPGQSPRPQPGPLTPAKQSLAAAVSEQSALALANLELTEKLRLQALRDPLTGLLNRRFVDEWINREVARTDQTGRSFGVIMADIDHFKQINDLHGHDAGDQLLKAVAHSIRNALRPGDLPCRYGGEEFLLLLADIDADVLRDRAEQVRTRISELRVSHRGGTLPTVTLSAGIAVYPEDGRTATQVIDAADAALYAAKRNGRNQIGVAHPISDAEGTGA
ncbi:diguanylate cyclase (GGDEF) domain-containing protein [Nakamurella panacisegetis]|uniref:Diguanylate cyclase (GGDEF) domain-containing protein n=1 Tax=Nakamurella panacisegetis TaxID=1090615 RepID=A0A1H0QPY6_9ACTN|nr:sensor domain-containing diguanylate cyclase [Nakamurella panacisegetis]SDP19404.1 diguanylate cyclase (GGDEF) domain-containing protein [Nakamurella panacisegetis]